MLRFLIIEGVDFMKKVLWYLEENLEEIFMVLALIAMTIIMGLQIVSRYILHISLSWSEEITRYIFIWAAFISVSLCTKKCISIKIDQFIKFFDKKTEAIFKIVNLVISLLFFLYLIPYAYRYLLGTIASGQVSPACQIPMAYVQSAPLVAFVLCSIRIIQRIVINTRVVMDSKNEFAEEGSLADSILDSVDSGCDSCQ